MSVPRRALTEVTRAAGRGVGVVAVAVYFSVQNTLVLKFSLSSEINFASTSDMNEVPIARALALSCRKGPTKVGCGPPCA
jgi:hypothetical protein